MSGEEERPRPTGGQETVFVLFLLLVGAVAFFALSLLTFGIPIAVVVLGGLIWMYVGLMKLLERALARLGGRGAKRR